MKRSRGALRTLFIFEMKMLLRDRRTVLFSVLLPILIFPAMILIMNVVERERTDRLSTMTYEYAVVGSREEWARALVERALALGAESPDSGEMVHLFEEKVVANPDSLLEAGMLHFVVRGLDAEEERALRAGEAEGREGMDSVVIGGGDAEGVPAETIRAPPGVASDASDLPVIRLEYRSHSPSSGRAMDRVSDLLEELRLEGRVRLLKEAGFPLAPDDVAPVEVSNVASAEEMTRAALGTFLTLGLIMLMLMGGSIVAADAISGEKERGTLETLLTTGVRHREIIAAKQLAIIAVGLTITLLNGINLLAYLVFGVFDLPENFAVSIPPISALVLLVLFLPVVLLVSSLLLLVSGYSKSYKEYQIYFFPVFLGVAIPSLASVLPGIELRSAIVLVPLANVSVAVKEVLAGEFPWIFLALTFVVTGAAALFASRLTTRALSVERLISPVQLDEAELLGGKALFPKRVLRWFGIFWVILFVSALWFGQELGVRGQLLVNLVGIFLGGSILIMRRYRLDVREVLALRPVAPVNWLAVLIGAPSAYLTGIGLAHLSNLILPVSEETLEAFGQFLLPEGMPLWQILLLLTILPGICEEIAFRGILLHGLRKRFHPVVLCVVVGAIFGIFHVDLFRLIPTAYLGIVIAASVLLTGSIFPAMLWHALNNAIGLVPLYFGWFGDGLPAWSFFAGVAGLALAFAILWRNRSVYPGLRGSGRESGEAG